MKVLVINAGSSSMKYQLINIKDGHVLSRGLIERIGSENSLLTHKNHLGAEKSLQTAIKNHQEAFDYLVKALVDAEAGVISNINEVSAVGHRIVHGGEKFSSSVVIDDEVIEEIKKCSSLAPLHNPPGVTAIEACMSILPGVKQVAVFDTAMHASMPPEAYIYPLPYELYTKYKIRKYGFHGTSHKYVSGRAASLIGENIENLKIVSLHLGNGSSITAVKGGRSIDTSMGFTPLAGVIMGTRCGDIDPAIVTFIMEKEGLSASQADEILNKKSGLLGISGVSNDMRDITKAAQEGNQRAKLALAVTEYSISKTVGAYAAAMNGIDAMVFTAGIGENDCGLRSNICKRLGFLGISIDEEKNSQRGKEMFISTQDSKVKVLVIPTNEELMIAEETYDLVK